MKKLVAVLAISIASFASTFAIECYVSLIQQIDCPGVTFISIYEYQGEGAGCDPAVLAAVYADASSTFQQNQMVVPC